MDRRMIKKAALYDSNDRISHLPKDVIIKYILNRIPFKDAVRTSILSRTWRNMWPSCSVLLLNKNFYQDNFKNKPLSQYRFCRFVFRILSIHIGPIDEFSFYIPNFEGFDITPDVDQWMRVLCKDTVKDLSLYNSCKAHPYKLPPSIFACFQLISLFLVNCLLEPPPHGFGGFCKLTRVIFWQVSFSADTFEALVPSATLLRELAFLDCSGEVYLRGSAPRLRLLHVFSTGELDSVFVLGILGSTPCLEELTLLGSNVVIFTENDNTSDLYKLLDRMPKVRSVMFGGSNLKLLSAGKVLEPLPSLLEHLTDVAIYGFKFNDFDHISCALYLLRSSPELKNFEIKSYTMEEAGTEEEIVVELLKRPDLIEDPLLQLQTIKLRSPKASRAELAFVKLLLGKAPWLKKMTIELLLKVNSVSLYLLTNKINSFPRASAAAELLITTPTPRSMGKEFKVFFFSFACSLCFISSSMWFFIAVRPSFLSSLSFFRLNKFLGNK